MASEIYMPRLGWTMEEGTFGAWLKQDGETVHAGDLIFTVEGDKATQEVEALDSGILRLPPGAPKPGDIVPVGALLAYIVQPGQPAPFEEQKGQGDKEAEGQGETRTIVSAQERGPGENRDPAIRNIQRRQSTSRISPRARRVAQELGVDWMKLEGSGATGRIVERDIRAAATQKPVEMRVRATPVAQRMAQDAGIDLAELAKQKAGDKIDRGDVEAAIAARPPHPATLAPEKEKQDSDEVVTTTRIRRLIAQRMAESAHTTAPVTLTTEADATELVTLREQLKLAFAPRNLVVPSYNDLLMKLTAVALQDHPMLNATWHGEEILIHRQIHIGLAADSAEGLVVPVIRDVQSKSLRQIAAESSMFIEQVQAHKLSPDALQGGTFTISNLGMYGIDAFTPIINLPQCAILGVGRIVQKPAVFNDQVTPRHMVTLSLTFDHRIVDGAPAARFLNTIREYIETPALWLAS